VFRAKKDGAADRWPRTVPALARTRAVVQYCPLGADHRPLGPLLMKIVSTTSKQRIWAYNAPVFGVKKEIPTKSEIPAQEVVMRLSFVAGCMLCSVLLFAQGVQTQEAPKVHSMTGCLKAGPTPGSYMLTDLARGPKTVGIVSSSVNLAPHVGHKVEITGVAVAEQEAMKENKDVPKAPHYMKVTAMKHISTTCP